MRRPRLVHVRFLRAERVAGPRGTAWARSLLGSDERRHHARLAHPEARRDYLATHVLKRTMLAELSQCDVTALTFRSGASLRPAIVAPHRARRLHFSLSRADGVAICCASSHAPLGADVESLRRVGEDPHALADFCCTARERAWLGTACPAERAARLLLLWTCKEAVAKATGVGVQLPVEQVDVVVGADGSAVATLPVHLTQLRRRWFVRTFWLTSSHLAAIASAIAPDEPVEWRVEQARLGDRCVA